MLIFWILIFVLSLSLLVKSADWFVESAERIGLAFKIPPFIIGVTIVALGTSFPELASAMAAVFKGATEIVAANVVGSNIANILLIIGLSAIVARSLTVQRSLIDLDAPLLAAITVLFIFIMLDREIVFGEGILLILASLVYGCYTVSRREEGKGRPEMIEVLPSRVERRRKEIKKRLRQPETEKLNFKVFFFLILGAIGLAVGANYTVESMLKVSQIFGIASSLIAITALAVGTSLPELVVSVKAAVKKKYGIALGNVFGSNIFNVLLVAGIPALIKPLKVDETTFIVGLPFLVIATLLFVVSGISRKIHIWEGGIYVLIYILFIVKVCGLF